MRHLCRPYGAVYCVAMFPTACAVGYYCVAPNGALDLIKTPHRGVITVAHCASGG